MKPEIDGTTFGSITVGGKTFQHDVLIRLDGAVKKRKKSSPRPSMAPLTPFHWTRPGTSTKRVPSD
jgi:hypothetical protein